jgi:hypothetical protein
MHTSFADFFAVKETQEISMHHGMQMWDESKQQKDCYEMEMKDCMENFHECCWSWIDYAVFQTEEYLISSILFDNIDTQTYQALIESNLKIQLNAPQYSNNREESRNHYTQLIGIIKNNA